MADQQARVVGSAAIAPGTWPGSWIGVWVNWGAGLARTSREGETPQELVVQVPILLTTGVQNHDAE